METGAEMEKIPVAVGRETGRAAGSSLVELLELAVGGLDFEQI